MLYFAYGSNMDTRQMRQRCQEAKFVSTAKLYDYKLTFSKWSNTWGGGVANIVPSRGEVVEGVLWDISIGDLESLDRYEGYPDYYTRGPFLIEKANKERVRAIAYYGKAEGDYRPSKVYKEGLVRGAREHGLSESYIKMLEDLETL